LIEADDRRLKEILINLLTNAIKFTSPGGKIGLEVTGEVERNLVHFIVWDTGIGISPENIALVFQPFVQVDSGLARQYEGAGLGLTLVRRMIEMHGGGITVESEPGKGSRFVVSLPWRNDGESPGQEDTRAEKLRRWRDTAGAGSYLLKDEFPASSRRLILVAEDNESSLDVLNDFLTESGYRVVLARSGTQVLELAQAEPPDLILMDIQMPGMHGLEVIRHIRATSSLKSVPIIAMTALAMDGDREMCLEAGADGYMSKPLSLKKLIATIEEHLLQRF
jgi:CheY-like chemotaxis protein/anti-sigma regulatory factor (Ser/Thr protein kinase)